MEIPTLWEAICANFAVALDRQIEAAPPAWPPAAAAIPIIEPGLLTGVEQIGEPVTGGNEGADTRADTTQYASENRSSALSHIGTQGIEALGWYAPITKNGRRAWGIYFHEANILGAAAELHLKLQESTLEQVAWALSTSIDVHECFHASVELSSLVGDDLAAYRSRSWRRRIDERFVSYPRYFDHVYAKTFPGRRCAEEGLATAAQFRSPEPLPGFFKALEELVRQSPEAYSSWERFKSDEAFEQRLYRLSAEVASREKRWQFSHGTQQVLGFIPPRAWHAPIAPAALAEFGPIPRYLWRTSHAAPRMFTPASFSSFEIRPLVACLRNRYGASLLHGGRHQNVLKFTNGKRVPLSASWDRLPHFVVKQICGALDIDRFTLQEACS